MGQKEWKDCRRNLKNTSNNEYETVPFLNVHNLSYSNIMFTFWNFATWTHHVSGLWTGYLQNTKAETFYILSSIYWGRGLGWVLRHKLLLPFQEGENWKKLLVPDLAGQALATVASGKWTSGEKISNFDFQTNKQIFKKYIHIDSIYLTNTAVCWAQTT